MKFEVGAVIKKPGSSLSYKTGGWKTSNPVFDHSKCNKCGICWIFCPEGIIYKTKEGLFEANLNYCKGCGICAQECPQKAIQMVRIK
jgi:pyruvate ferredoxin oxidoreductase delta subunit